MTLSVSKQLLPIYDKPMIYYPLTTLILAGVTEVGLISDPRNLKAFRNLLGDGSGFGLRITYIVQERPNGLAEAYLLARDFLSGEMSCLILGDNLFHGPGLGKKLGSAATSEGAKIFGYEVAHPESYGVVILDANGKPLELIEKPKTFVSSLAVPGIYFFDGSAPSRAASLRPSRRGELEITDLLSSYLGEGKMEVEELPRGSVWLDTGTVDTYAEAIDYVRVIQNRQGRLIGSPEEAAFRMGLISQKKLLEIASQQSSSAYGSALLKVAGEIE